MYISTIELVSDLRRNSQQYKSLSTYNCLLGIHLNVKNVGHINKVLPRNCARAWCGFKGWTYCMCCVTMFSHCWEPCLL